MNHPAAIAAVCGLAGGITASLMTRDWRYAVLGLALMFICAVIGSSADYITQAGGPRNPSTTHPIAGAGLVVFLLGVAGSVWTFEWRWLAIGVAIGLVLVALGGAFMLGHAEGGEIPSDEGDDDER